MTELGNFQLLAEEGLQLKSICVMRCVFDFICGAWAMDAGPWVCWVRAGFESRIVGQLYVGHGT